MIREDFKFIQFHSFSIQWIALDEQNQDMTFSFSKNISIVFFINAMYDLYKRISSRFNMASECGVKRSMSKDFIKMYFIFLKLVESIIWKDWKKIPSFSVNVILKQNNDDTCFPINTHELTLTVNDLLLVSQEAVNVELGAHLWHKLGAHMRLSLLRWVGVVADLSPAQTMA